MKPGSYAKLVKYTLGMFDAWNCECEYSERTVSDEDILVAVSYNWSENVCERYYGSLNT